MTAKRVFIALGTNLGDRQQNLRSVLAAFPPDIHLVRASAVYETEPWGYTAQEKFLNQVVEVETELSPAELLALLKRLESQLGREPTFRYGPRRIDLDILLYEDQVVDLPELRIPHPRLAERAFVLVPLADLAADLTHPLTGKTIGAMLTEIDTGGVRLWEPLAGQTDQAAVMPETPLSWGTRTFLMGILNVTPDSFSGDGLLQKDQVVTAALEQARQFANTGADILDIGGESTRPGSQPVGIQEELDRVMPVIEALVAEEIDAILSIDTYKAEVAEAALSAGAHWVNDVWGLRADPHLAEVAARHKAPVVLMHNRSKPANAELQEKLGGRYVGMQYDNLIADIRRELMESVAIARQAGISDDHIILDPGIGFGKTVEQNLELIDRLNEFRSLGFPLLLGPSRKSFIGYTLDLPPEERMEGTAAAVAIGITRGIDIVRVHDVVPIARVVRMTDAIVRPRMNRPTTSR